MSYSDAHKRWFQSPQWGSNSKDFIVAGQLSSYEFQSPQWGSNSKGYPLESL